MGPEHLTISRVGVLHPLRERERKQSWDFLGSYIFSSSRHSAPGAQCQSAGRKGIEPDKRGEEHPSFTQPWGYVYIAIKDSQLAWIS